MGAGRIKPELRAAIAALVAAGKADREIVAELGVTKSTVCGMRRRMGLESNMDRGNSWSLQRHREIAGPAPTLFDRMAEIEAHMEAVLAECADRPEFHAKLPAATGNVFVLEGRK